MVAATVRTIFAHPDPVATRAHLRTVADTLAPRFPKVAELLLAAEVDVTAYADFPRHPRRIASTNPLERVHKEIKRRSNVVGIHRGDAVIRLVGAVLLEVDDDWQTSDRRYLSEGSMRQIDQEVPSGMPALPAAWPADTTLRLTPALSPRSGTLPCRSAMASSSRNAHGRPAPGSPPRNWSALPMASP